MSLRVLLCLHLSKPYLRCRRSETCCAACWRLGAGHADTCNPVCADAHSSPTNPTLAPQAFGNVLRRMLEAAGRGMWAAKPEVLDQLRALYAEMDDELEGVTGPTARTAQKGAAAPKK